MLHYLESYICPVWPLCTGRPWHCVGSHIWGTTWHALSRDRLLSPSYAGLRHRRNISHCLQILQSVQNIFNSCNLHSQHICSITCFFFTDICLETNSDLCDCAHIWHNMMCNCQHLCLVTSSRPRTQKNSPAHAHIIQ